MKFKSSFVLLTNNLNSKGKHISGEKTCYECLLWAKRTKSIKSFTFFRNIIFGVKPLIELKKKKVGGAQYRIPVYLFKQKGVRLAVKWVVQSSCGRKLGERGSCLRSELNLLFLGQGKAIEKKRSLYEQALLNRAFIKYL